VYTPFEQHNQDFSDRAHAAARSLVYPQLFGCDESLLQFDSASVGDGGEKAILDGQMAIDRLVDVTVHGLRSPLRRTIQERFRRPGYKSYRDITITEFNHNSGQPSELHKMKCGLFVYGYFCEEDGSFCDLIVVDVPRFLMALTTRDIGYDTNRNRKNQSFICVKYEDLHKAGVVVFHSKSIEAMELGGF